MKTFSAFIKAIHIFAKHEDKGLDTSFIFEAEHDVIYSHLEVGKETPEEAAQLKELGWHKDTDIDVWAYFT